MKEFKKSTVKEIFVTNKEEYKDYVTELGKNDILFMDLTSFVYSPKFDVGILYDIKSNRYATDVNSEYRPILNENMEIGKVIELIEKDLQFYFKSLTISEFFTDYINDYMEDDGSKDFGRCISLFEEEIYDNKLFKSLLGNKVYDELTKLFKNIGVDEIIIYKEKDGTFTFIASSSITDKDYRCEKIEEDDKINSIFLDLSEYLKKKS